MGFLKALPDAARHWHRLGRPRQSLGQIGLRWKLVTFTPDNDGFDKATAFVRAELDAGAGHTLTLAGYLAAENLYILCDPAIATPGLQLITAADLKHYWRSDHYGELSHGVL